MLSLSLSIALSELPRRYDLIRVVTLNAAVMTSGSLTYLVGRRIAFNDSNQTSTSHIKKLQIHKTLVLQKTISTI